MKANITTSIQEIKKLKDFPRIDPHVHTHYSDGCQSVKELVKRAKKRGLSVITKADHNTLRGNTELEEICKEERLTYIPGIEKSTEKGHLVILNIDSIKLLKGLNFIELLEKINEENGIGILAHPWWRDSIREEVFNYSELHGYEGLNGSSPYGSRHFLKNIQPPKKMEQYNKHSLVSWVGSDSHAGHLYGKYFNLVVTTEDSQDGILEAMRKGRILGYGPPLPLLDFLIDGAINQPVQLRNEMFYRK